MSTNEPQDPKTTRVVIITLGAVVVLVVAIICATIAATQGVAL